MIEFKPEYLDHYRFKHWWMKKRAHEIVAAHKTGAFLLEPTEKDWRDYLDDCVEADEVL